MSVHLAAPRRTSEPGPAETLDAICGGRVRLLQRVGGYRFNLDPILLAHFACPEPGALEGRVIDLGTGSGIIPLILARKLEVESVGLELQESLFRLAERNLVLNRCESKVDLVHGDLRRARALFPPASFAHVICNPPYHPAKAGRINPAEEKAIARHELESDLGDVLAAAAHLLEPLGSLWLVFPAARLAELIRSACEARLPPVRLRLVHPRLNAPAKLALVQAVKGGQRAMIALPPLVIHQEDQAAFTPEVEAMLA